MTTEQIKKHFKLGKWYKSPRWSNFWIKIAGYGTNKVIINERINEGSWKEATDKYDYYLETYIEADISEIEKYLPNTIEQYSIF